MRCYYEVLGCEPSADADALKRAYRRAALRWHPDKNGGSEEAEEMFKDVQAAWEVLSDAKERAWYDDHREAILRGGAPGSGGGGDGAHGGGPPPDEPNLYQYFGSGAYRGYGDDPAGFYATYERVFETLAALEREASTRAAQRAAAAGSARHEREPTHLPAFGGSSASAESVGAFYRAWQGFTSARTFAWADKYNPNDAPSRFVRRRMEEDNRRERKRAKRSYTDTVRELVNFVKKRDKRMAVVAAAAAKREAEREAARAAHRAAQDAQRRARVEAARAAEAAAAAAARAARGGSESDSGDAEPSDYDYIEEEVYECVVCDKIFKSSKQLRNHERSRKHREAMDALRREMLAEEEEEMLAEMAEHEAAEATVIPDTGDGGTALDGATETGNARTESSEAEEEEEEEEEEEASDDEEAMLARMMGSMRVRTAASDVDGDTADSESGGEAEVDEGNTMCGDNGVDVPGAADGNESRNDSDCEHRSRGDDSNARNAASGAGAAEAPPADVETNAAGGSRAADHDCGNAHKEGDDSGDVGAGAKPPVVARVAEQEADGHARAAERKARRKLKKALKAAAGAGGKGSGNGIDPGNMCKVCGETFPSRTALFRHIRSSGHAALRSV